MKRAPLIVVSSDDFNITADGETYYPHKGEIVTFRRHISPRDLMALLDAEALSQEKTAKDVASYMHNTICPILSHIIVDWNWTDPYSPDEDNPEPYQKPTVESLRGLDVEELQYLVGKWFEATAQGSSEKNPPTTSSEQ